MIQKFNIFRLIVGGQDLIDKIYNGLDKEKIKRKENIDVSEKLKYVGKFFNLESKTLNYLKWFIHSFEMINKLYNYITLENVIKIED